MLSRCAIHANSFHRESAGVRELCEAIKEIVRVDKAWDKRGYCLNRTEPSVLSLFENDHISKHWFSDKIGNAGDPEISIHGSRKIDLALWGNPKNTCRRWTAVLCFCTKLDTCSLNFSRLSANRSIFIFFPCPRRSIRLSQLGTFRNPRRLVSSNGTKLSFEMIAESRSSVTAEEGIRESWVLRKVNVSRLSSAWDRRKALAIRSIASWHEVSINDISYGWKIQLTLFSWLSINSLKDSINSPIWCDWESGDESDAIIMMFAEEWLDWLRNLWVDDRLSNPI